MANAESGVRRTIKTAVIVAAEVWISTLPVPWWVFPAALLAGVLYLVWTWVPPGKGAMGHIRLASLVVVAIWLVGIAIAARHCQVGALVHESGVLRLQRSPYSRNLSRNGTSSTRLTG